MSNKDDPDIRIGISACLLGERVRYDGGHKHQPFLVEQLVKHFVLEPLCPEVAIGLGVPRPPIQLIGTPGNYRAVDVKMGNLDVTHRLEQFAAHCSDRLEPVSGYILKRGSPSCGIARVNIHPPDGGHAAGTGSGIFARALMALPPFAANSRGGPTG